VRSIVTLLTDFGLADSYVAEIKAAILSHSADPRLVDISHQVAPGDVRAAQYLLARAWRRFPAGTVHLVVVDPGVGSARRAMAARSHGHHFVGPDNGVFTQVLEHAEIVELSVPPGASSTFHGRDVFAPAAARLALGEPLAGIGAGLSNPIRLPLPAPRREAGVVAGEVIYVDAFGTLIANIPGDWAQGATGIEVSGKPVGALHRTFADVASGGFVAFVGSDGLLEIAVRDGSAARKLGVGVGAEVRVR
jgi:hypothetical protein